MRDVLAEANHAEVCSACKRNFVWIIPLPSQNTNLKPTKASLVKYTQKLQPTKASLVKYTQKLQPTKASLEKYNVHSHWDIVVNMLAIKQFPNDYKRPTETTIASFIIILAYKKMRFTFQFSSFHSIFVYLYTGTVMPSFYHGSILTHGNWFQTIQPEHESDDHARDTLTSVCVTNEKHMELQRQI